ncbi:hypothetical protein [Rhodococcus sp. NPDC060176]|uniref:hypothetical protein n=1 Tax=Rhodococcus sp. NPDC060176 TaxID=3347062 RepID=UPI003657C9BB
MNQEQADRYDRESGIIAAAIVPSLPVEARTYIESVLEIGDPAFAVDLALQGALEFDLVIPVDIRSNIDAFVVLLTEIGAGDVDRIRHWTEQVKFSVGL